MNDIKSLRGSIDKGDAKSQKSKSPSKNELARSQKSGSLSPKKEGELAASMNKSVASKGDLQNPNTALAAQHKDAPVAQSVSVNNRGPAQSALVNGVADPNRGGVNQSQALVKNNNAQNFEPTEMTKSIPY